MRRLRATQTLNSFEALRKMQSAELVWRGLTSEQRRLLAFEFFATVLSDGSRITFLTRLVRRGRDYRVFMVALDWAIVVMAWCGSNDAVALLQIRMLDPEMREGNDAARLPS